MMPHALAADGTHLAYQCSGLGEPLVLLAGQANNHHWWDPVRADFEESRTTITMDYRGTGESDRPEGPYSTTGFADDVIEVLDDLGIDRADIYGTSMGGRTAQWVAVRHPDRVRRLVLGCTSPGGKQAFERGPEVRRSLAQFDSAAVERALLELMYTPSWLATHAGPFATTGDASMSLVSRRLHLAASNGHDAWDVLPQITAPTLVLHGSDDIFNPAGNGPLLAGRIPGAVLEMIPGARHAYFEEFREIASPLVLKFLAAE